MYKSDPELGGDEAMGTGEWSMDAMWLPWFKVGRDLR